MKKNYIGTDGDDSDYSGGMTDADYGAKSGDTGGKSKTDWAAIFSSVASILSSVLKFFGKKSNADTKSGTPDSTDFSGMDGATTDKLIKDGKLIDPSGNDGKGGSSWNCFGLFA